MWIQCIDTAFEILEPNARLSQSSLWEYRSVAITWSHSCIASAVGGMKVTPVPLRVHDDPIFMKRPIISLGLREPVQKALTSLCNRGILTPVESSLWATPIVTPLKKDGITPRICGDYWLTLNEPLYQHCCITDGPEDIFNRLYGSKCFSKIDLKDANLQIPLDPESSSLTTITTPFGLFRYNYLPPGLTVSPAIFQSVINSIVTGVDGVEVYQDDIIVHGAEKCLHDVRLLSLFEKFCQFNVLVNPDKCEFSITTFNCLGYTVSEYVFTPDKDRLSTLFSLATPTNNTKLRSVLGALEYYSRFIPSFSNRANCLFNYLLQLHFFGLMNMRYVSEVFSISWNPTLC